ncbi:MAG: hemin-degrading factor [Cytophagaceae bacterium]|nr:hemin-degrading factor [Cytophagaceae bacterium]
MNTKTPNTLRERWDQFKLEHPSLRIREAALQLQTTEAELLATQMGSNTWRLEGDIKEMLAQLPSLGYVMALTRNNEAVLERKGIYEQISFSGNNGLVLGPDIDLRMFLNTWKFVFAVKEGARQSIQFFDETGTAVHKVFLTERSNESYFYQFIDRFKAPIQTELLEICSEKIQPTPERPDKEIDVPAFQKEWRALQDTHDFFGLLKRFQLSRTQALRLAPDGFARLVPATSLRTVLQGAVAQQLEIMIFVGNHACIQIHTGSIYQLKETAPWYNILDPELNLHLREDALHQCWIVCKPTRDGLVHSLEAYNKAGENIALIFGKRKPGKPELETWSTLLNGI